MSAKLRKYQQDFTNTAMQVMLKITYSAITLIFNITYTVMQVMLKITHTAM